MPQTKVTPKRQTLSARKHPVRRKIPWLAIAIPLAVLALLSIGGMSYAASMEENDPFCGSCHTQPESTFLTRSTASSATDLASFHTSKAVKCIDCHSGEGIPGRVSAIMLGAHNAFALYTNTAIQPAQLTSPITDDHCLKCHSQVMNQSGFNNHFHAFLPRWQANDPNAAHCSDCHLSHHTDGQADIQFLNQTHTEQICQQCHSALGEGGE